MFLFGFGECKLLNDKRKRDKPAYPFRFVHLAGIEPARVLSH